LVDGVSLLPQGTVQSGSYLTVSLRDFAFDPSGRPLDHYTLTSNNPGVIQVEYPNAKAPTGRLRGDSPGTAEIIACAINFYNRTVCKPPELLTVPAPETPQPNAGGANQTPGISSAVSIGGPLLVIALILGPIFYSRRKQQKQAEGLILDNRGHRNERKKALPNKAEDTLGNYHDALTQTFHDLSHGRNPVPSALICFRSGLVLLFEREVEDQLLIVKIKELTQSMSPIKPENNSERVIQSLTVLLCLTTLIAASHMKDKVVDYTWRNDILHWVDDKASLVRGKMGKDYRTKAFLKLIRSMLEPLQTNETGLHYLLGHIVGVLGTFLKYLKSRKHQGNFQQTTKVIDGVIALAHTQETTSITKALKMASTLMLDEDWRLKALGVIIKASTQEGLQALSTDSLRRDPSSPQLTKKRGCCSCFSAFSCRKKGVRRAMSRTALIIEELLAKVPITPSSATMTTNPMLHLHKGPGAGEGSTGEEKDAPSPRHHRTALIADGARRRQKPPPPPIPAPPTGDPEELL
jgi:hypothetical protein